MPLHLSLFTCLAAAPALWLLLSASGGRARVWATLIPALLPAALFVGFVDMLPAVTAGGVLVETWQWIPSLGVTLALRVDGLSLLFALLITGIGSLIFLYASRYLAGHVDLPRFFTRLTLFMAAMLGAVLADDLITLLVFWEMTSLASFLLIGFEPEKPASRRSAQQGLLITVGGGLALLAGAIVLGNAANTYRISEILERAPELAAHPSAPWVILLVAVGAFAKSAQVPLHAWLPNAMVAPTPVSAYLHSATMVIAILANAVMVGVAGVVTLRVFWGPLRPTPKTPHDPPVAMWVGPALLALVGLGLGLAPGLAGGLVSIAADTVAGGETETQLALWHGLTPMLGLSVLTLVLGWILYLRWDEFHRFLAAREAIARWGPDGGYDRLLERLQRLARWQGTATLGDRGPPQNRLEEECRRVQSPAARRALHAQPQHMTWTK